MPAWLVSLLPILGLVSAIALVLARLPRIELGHSATFVRRRALNWAPLGLTYAFLYMARYNLAAAKNDLGEALSNEDYGNIKAAGTIVYGIAFLLNGPLTDRIGGRATILLAALGAAVANVGLGVVVLARPGSLALWLGISYAMNMYFQSFGAVSIVKVNAAWFHLRERGTFAGIFGILISLGIYFAFDWSPAIARMARFDGVARTEWVFFVPALVLVAFFAIDWLLVRDTPADAGLPDIDTGDGSPAAGSSPGQPVPRGLSGELRQVASVAGRMLSQPVILVIAAIEFCSGFLRSALLDWFPLFARQTGVTGDVVASNWGLMNCLAGILGGIVAGVISDRLFAARRGPVASVLYAALVVGSVVMFASLGAPAVLSATLVLMVLAVIGVHGMLSGAASMDFGGRRNVGVVVGIIDGLVYLGQGAQYLILGHALPSEPPASAEPWRWWPWPAAMLPVATMGLLLATLIWNAKPKASSH